MARFGLPPREDLMRAIVEHAAAIALHAIGVRMEGGEEIVATAEEQLAMTGQKLTQLLDEIYK
jgi:hypothetical protein